MFPKKYISLLASILVTITMSAQTNRPNIIWISCEDLSPHFSFYGDNTIPTPNLDRLAREAVVYDNVFTTAGVCAPSRCAIITGMNQVSVGGHNMRTLYDTHSENRGLPKSYSIVPAPEVKAFPEYLRASGYYCTNNTKTDYQFEAPPTVWDESGPKATWKNRKPGQQFFAVFNDTKTHESQVWVQKNHPLHIDPANVKVPPFYPDTKTVRNDIARFYSNVVDMDSTAGVILRELEEAGLMDSTIIFFWSDHGDGLPYCKRELYDRGIKIPLLVRMPGKINAGTRDTRLISSIDFSATVLSLAGIKKPANMQGKAFLGKHIEKEHEYVYAARDRMDSEVDRVRAVRDKRFKYIRNFHPELPPYQDIAYRLQQNMMKEILELRDKGLLDSIQMKWFASKKPTEELYDLSKDPYELNNLALNANYQKELTRFKKEMDSWLLRMGDKGGMTEKEMIQQIWEGKSEPPVTKDVVITANKNNILLSCETNGASIGYKIIDSNKPEPSSWEVYQHPFQVTPGQSVKVVAQRIGFVKSKEISFQN